MKTYFVYILTTKKNKLLYIGVTNNIERRVYEHKVQKNKGYTSKYSITKLVYYEVFQDIIFAIDREKQLKNWNREWKFDLIKSKNPDMIELADELGNITSFIMLYPESSSG